MAGYGDTLKKALQFPIAEAVAIQTCQCIYNIFLFQEPSQIFFKRPKYYVYN